MWKPLPTLAALALLAGCPPPPVATDAGAGTDAGLDAGIDSGVAPPACSGPADCKAIGFDGVCRAGACAAFVACADDVECGLGEQCLNTFCAFTGCAADSDCSSNKCRTDVFACAECGSNADCPTTRPVCEASSNKCIQCATDAHCSPPGPAHCDAPSGACVHCLTSNHCPNGLACGANHVCVGAPENAGCPNGVTCGAGLTCVQLGTVNTCLPSCDLARPTCATGKICYKLVFASSASLVFDNGTAIGVCYTPQSGLKNFRESCGRPYSTQSSSNCQPNLTCIPDTPSLSLCRTFCDPSGPNPCPGSELCHSFTGDYNAHQYGLCYPDNGWGAPCTKDSACKTGLACAPYEDASALEDLSTVCQFEVGASPGLAPCANLQLPDGGALNADKTCASGSCQADPLSGTLRYYCYSACAVDADCSVGGRTGSCDGNFVFPAIAAVTGRVKGCRPGCGSHADCAEYGPVHTCRSRFISGFNAAFASSCAPPAGPGLAGTPCFQNSQCRSGTCLLEDGRGVRRLGFCAEVCETAADCEILPDGGVLNAGMPLACAPVTFMGYRGPDGQPATADDKLLTAKLCAGSACTVDSDCSTDGGPRCVPDVDPSDAGALVLRCRRPTGFSVSAGQPCNVDLECQSGVCGTLQPPSTGGGKACFEACTAASACPASLSCRPGGMRVKVIGGFADLDSCAP